MARVAVLLVAVLAAAHAVSASTSARAQVSTVVVTLSREGGEDLSSSFQAYNALFGTPLRPGEQMQGDFVQPPAGQDEGCSAWTLTEAAGDAGCVAVIARGSCPFGDKLRHALGAGCHSAVVYDHIPGSDVLVNMALSDEESRLGLSYAFGAFVSYRSGIDILQLAEQADAGRRPFVRIEATSDEAKSSDGAGWMWNVHLRMTAALGIIVAVTCFSFMTLYVVYARRSRHQPPRPPPATRPEDLNAIPTRVFGDQEADLVRRDEPREAGSGDDDDVCERDRSEYGSRLTCAICLDDFEVGTVLRTLPCSHEFHIECLDPWLTKRSRSCPLCKHDITKAFVRQTSSTSAASSTTTRTSSDALLSVSVTTPAADADEACASEGDEADIADARPVVAASP